MQNELTNPIALGAEAILELEELKRGMRSAAPTLCKLFHFLRTPMPAFQGQGVSMLADVRSYVLFRDSVPQPPIKTKDLSEFREAVESYLHDLEAGVNARNIDTINEAKRFCLAFNENLLAKQMTEIFGRREPADSPYMGHESLL